LWLLWVVVDVGCGLKLPLALANGIKAVCLKGFSHIIIQNEAKAKNR